MSSKCININFENCYGIKSLNQSFDFSVQNSYVIYAPNGAMKTSFADTFRDFSKSSDTVDRLYPDRVTKRAIVDENNSPLDPDSILVLSPYDATFGLTEKTSTLLVDSQLKIEYEQLHIEIDTARTTFINALRERSGTKKDIEKEISATFTRQDNQFYRALIRIKDEVNSQDETLLADVHYDTIYEDKVLSFLETEDFKIHINEYVDRYNELLDSSKYFSRRTFNHFNARQIAKSLVANGFFDAKHSVNFKSEETLEITNQDQLEELISREESQITNDEDLKKKFERIKKGFEKNITLREFLSYLQEHPALLPRLVNLDSLKEDIWKSYIKTCEHLYEDLVTKYQNNEKRKQVIEERARGQRTQWENVIDIFNDRFFVPFRLEAKNREAVILGDESMLNLGFVFKEDGGEEVIVERDTLIRALSTGEKKALYVLNIIFEIEARRNSRQETIFIIDDIADSFDYRNKYAIIQYLMDIAEDSQFKQILLTHNFDFFRTVNSRFIRYSQCLMAIKTSYGLSIQQAKGIKNPFVNDWKKEFYNNPIKRAASIPFIRNIIEWTKSGDDPDFLTLTALLHWKKNSSRITQSELDRIYNNLFGDSGDFIGDDNLVVEMIENTADTCISCNGSDDGINFESKIVLSIAIRNLSEKFMVEKIGDPSFVEGIKSNQSQKLLNRFIQDFPGETNKIDVIKRVILMTPENIHLNSFMYEPILDMSDEHLKKLYLHVKALNNK